MKNAFIIKNADVSFDLYYQMMRKRKNLSPTKLVRDYQLSQGSQLKVIEGKQPPGRDGHSSFQVNNYWVIFGGDRHHMPFNDTYVLDLEKVVSTLI